MPVIPAHFKLALTPAACPDAIVECGQARFTVLADRLIRLETQSDGHFTDRASQAFWFRRQPVPPFTTRQTDHRLEIETEALHLRYDTSAGAGFTPDNLTITLKASGAVWHPGAEDAANLGGTARTLDYANGYIPFEPGLMSRAGWAVIDNSRTLLFDDDGWLQPRPDTGTDLYFFGYGHDYPACLRDYCLVSGGMPMIPRWALGNWWSRYWAYSQDELADLIGDFQTHELPFSVCILDMDWHLTETGNDSTGWTGYTWNEALFPAPGAFLDFAHQRRLKIGLNLHPAEGIHPHEAQYEAVARALHIDPATRQPVAFDISDPAFASAYLSLLHHPYEALGVDFWWLDWQQGLKSRLPGLDPLWLINHLHFFDLGRDGTRRPFIFSRWGREGHQRYPIGFSGNSYATWDTLHFQPYMTATASNIAYGWWSHDIGGHTGGTEDPELFVRWVQSGVLSPINRIHATKGLFYDRRPWSYEDADVLHVVKEALQLRHALVPYIYTMGRRAYDDSRPLIEPMYYAYPEAEEAYHCPQQYHFGTELLAAPFVDPKDPATGLSRQVVWLPEGDWFHVFSGEQYTGNRWQPVYGRLADIPLFARAGAIVPLAGNPAANGVDNPEALDLLVFAGADHAFTLYEDDGETVAYQANQACRTTFSQVCHADHLTLTLNPPEGDTRLIPRQRRYRITVRGVAADVTVRAAVDRVALDVAASYDAATESLLLSGIALEATATLEITLGAGKRGLLARRDRTADTVLRLLRHFQLHTGVRSAIAAKLDAILADPRQLAPYILTMQPAQARALCEILFDAGLHHVPDTIAPHLLIIWNNRQLPDLTYRYNHAHLFFGAIRALHHEDGAVPPFGCFIPPAERWSHGAQQEVVHRTQWEVQVDYANIFSASESYREATP